MTTKRFDSYEDFEIDEVAQLEGSIVEETHEKMRDLHEDTLNDPIDVKPLVQSRVPVKILTPADWDTYSPIGPVNTRALILRYAQRLLLNGPFSLKDIEDWKKSNLNWSGVYAVYYHGDLELYEGQKSEAADFPIYMGSSGNIITRLSTHIATVSHSEIPLTDLTFRFITVPKEWFLFVERNLVEELYKPVWNEVSRGFGAGWRDREWATRTKNKTNRWAICHSTENKPMEYRANKNNRGQVTKIHREIQRGVRAAQKRFQAVTEELKRIPAGVTPGDGRLVLLK